MPRVSITNEETEATLLVGVKGAEANAGGRTGCYEVKPGESIPVELGEDTTLTFATVTPPPAAA
jgi:hypothetical protein